MTKRTIYYLTLSMIFTGIAIGFTTFAQGHTSTQRDIQQQLSQIADHTMSMPSQPLQSDTPISIIQANQYSVLLGS